MTETITGLLLVLLLANAVLLARLRALQRQASRERKQYTQGLRTVQEALRAESDPQSLARQRLRILAADSDHILRRAHSRQNYSRRTMHRYGMSARRWNAAHSLLRDVKALPLGLHTPQEGRERMKRRIRELWQAARHVSVLPY